MPILVSHLGGANKEMLRRANRNSKHTVFGKVICFRKLCRIQSGHTASLRPMTRKQFERKVSRNARKGLYHDTRPPLDSTKRSAPKQSPSVPAAPSPALPPVKNDTLIVLGAEVLFETNHAALRPQHYKTLKSIADYLRSQPHREVTVSGHTDDRGGEEYNLALSRRRAEAVATYLINNGVNTRRVRSFGFGSTKPIAPNDSDTGRSKNRRVELLIHDPR